MQIMGSHLGFVRVNIMVCMNWTPFHKGLRLIASCTQIAIELRWISIVRLIATLCETGPWHYRPII